MHGGLSRLSALEAVSLSPCHRPLSRATGPEPDSNSSPRCVCFSFSHTPFPIAMHRSAASEYTLPILHSHKVHKTDKKIATPLQSLISGQSLPPSKKQITNNGEHKQNTIFTNVSDAPRPTWWLRGWRKRKRWSFFFFFSMFNFQIGLSRMTFSWRLSGPLAPRRLDIDIPPAVWSLSVGQTHLINEKASNRKVLSANLKLREERLPAWHQQ